MKHIICKNISLSILAAAVGAGAAVLRKDKIDFSPALHYNPPINKAAQVMGMWMVFALLSAVFAALTSILATIGIDGVNSNLATAVRTVVVVIMAWGMVFLTHTQSGISEISRKNWGFLILSGLATGAFWLCYYRALQVGDASKVVPIDNLSVVITLVEGVPLFL